MKHAKQNKKVKHTVNRMKDLCGNVWDTTWDSVNLAIRTAVTVGVKKYPVGQARPMSELPMMTAPGMRNLMNEIEFLDIAPPYKEPEGSHNKYAPRTTGLGMEFKMVDSCKTLGKYCVALTDQLEDISQRTETAMNSAGKVNARKESSREIFRRLF